MVLHTHSGAGPTDNGLGPGMLPIYATEACWWAAGRCGCSSGAASSSATRSSSTRWPRTRAWWVPDLVAQEWTRSGSAATTPRKFGDVFREV